MQLTDILSQVGGLQSITRELGISEAQAAAGASALAPAILGGFKKQAQGPAGLEGMGGLLGQPGGGDLLDNVLAAEPTDIGRGNDVLGQIFGSKDVSRTVAQNAASQSGLDPALIKKMLPIVAMLVAGYMAKQRGTSQLPGASGGLGAFLADCSAASREARRRPAVEDSDRCSISMATAIRSTTSCAWPASCGDSLSGDRRPSIELPGPVARTVAVTR